jgi:hypothetical protein
MEMTVGGLRYLLDPDQIGLKKTMSHHGDSLDQPVLAGSEAISVALESTITLLSRSVQPKSRLRI